MPTFNTETPDLKRVTDDNDRARTYTDAQQRGGQNPETSQPDEPLTVKKAAVAGLGAAALLAMGSDPE